VRKKRKQRTSQQNRALYKLFSLYCEALNDGGYSVLKTLRHDVEIPWNPILFKNLIWKPIQEAMTGKHSTTELNTVDPTEIHQVLDRHLAEKFGVSVPWPSEENR
jgi:hypothetical protein